MENRLRLSAFTMLEQQPTEHLLESHYTRPPGEVWAEFCDRVRGTVVALDLANRIEWFSRIDAFEQRLTRPCAV